MRERSRSFVTEEQRSIRTKGGIGFALAMVAAASIASARADDVGSHPDLRAIRHDVPILMAHWMPQATIRVGDVIVLGDDAIATWSAGALDGVVTLHRRSDRWWMTRNASVNAGEKSREAGIASQLGVPDRLAVLAQAHASALAAGVTPASFSASSSGASPRPRASDRTDFFDAEFAYAPTRESRPVVFRGRAATPAEMPPTPGENGLYFFAISSDASGSVRLDGATLDVWFPFALDPQQQYVLWLGFTDPEIRALPGMLHDNVLHFALPPFAFSGGKTALGEIDCAGTRSSASNPTPYNDHSTSKQARRL